MTRIMNTADDVADDETRRIWWSLTPAQRDYDRLVARSIPYFASWGPETPEGRALQAERDSRRDDERAEASGCSCHINPPCQWCTSQSEEDK